MAIRGQPPRQGGGGKSSSKTKGASSQGATEPGGSRSDVSSPGSDDEEGRRNKMTPIERIFLEEVGRELEPEERQILLGIHRTRRKSQKRARTWPSSPNG